MSWAEVKVALTSLKSTIATSETVPKAEEQVSITDCQTILKDADELILQLLDIKDEASRNRALSKEEQEAVDFGLLCEAKDVTSKMIHAGRYWDYEEYISESMKKGCRKRFVYIDTPKGKQLRGSTLEFFNL